MLTVVFSPTQLALPVRVPTGGQDTEDQAPAGLPAGRRGLAAQQSRHERPGLCGVLTAGTTTLEIPLGPQQGSSGKRCLHGLQHIC